MGKSRIWGGGSIGVGVKGKARVGVSRGREQE